MTPSDKPERSDSSPKQQEANQTSVITESTGARTDNPSADTSSSDGDGEAKASQTTEADSSSSPSSSSPSSSNTVSSSTASNGDGTDGDGTDAPPPWQRASATPSGTDSTTASSPADVEDTQTIPKPAPEPETVRTEVPHQPPGQDGRTAVTFGAGARPGASGTATGARRPSRGPRRASLQVKRVDPWSVLKLALVLSVALFFVWMIAVAVLYGVLDGMGVWDQLNGTFSDLTQPEDAASDPLISAGRVFGVASIIGAINIVLFTALATVAAFIYNVAADFAGGVEVTLSERE